MGRLKKAKKKNVRQNVTVRMNEEEINRAKQKAELYCEGNLAEWFRYAVQNCTPRRRDLDGDE